MNFIFDPSLVLYLPLYELDGASFISKGKHGHLCTVTGALWTPRGKDFDGTDDKIALPSGTGSPSLAPDEGTFIFWVYAITAGRYFYSQSINEWAIYHTEVGGPTLYYDGGAVFSFDVGTFSAEEWVHLAFTFKKGETGYGYLFGEEKKSGSCSATSPTAGAINIGARSDNASYIEMVLGEFLQYNRALTPLEIQHHYLATKWRYR